MIADTSVLVRGIVLDDRVQSQLAAKTLAEAVLIAVPLVVCCELVWVLGEAYKFRPQQIAGALQELVATSKVRMDRLAVQAGIDSLQAGGDFADGVNAHEGRKLGGTVFVSFDRKALRLVRARGFEVLSLPSKL